MKMSLDGKYLALKNMVSPTSVFIWDINAMELNTVLVHKNEVTSLDFT